MPNWRCSPRIAARPLVTIRSTVSRSATSRSGTWVVAGTTRSVGPASIIATRSLGDAAALGDELGLAGMDEADRVELRLRDRAGDEAGGGSRPGEPDRQLERVEGVAGAVEGRLAGGDGAAAGHLDDGKGGVEQGGGLARVADRRDRPVPDRLDCRDIADREEKRDTVAPPPRPAFRDHLSADARRVAQRDGQRAFRTVSDNRPPRRAADRAGNAARGGSPAPR